MPAHDPIALGRDAYARFAWRDAYDHLRDAAEDRDLDPDDLDLLARAAYLTGQIERAAEAWERAYRASAAQGDKRAAARSAFWLGMTLAMRGDHARGGGWMSRAHSILEGEPDCAERAYLQIPAVLQLLDAGDTEAARRILVQLTQDADRFDDHDLRAFGRLGQGQALIAEGDASGGVAMLDEAMVAVTTGEVSAVTAGIVYCAMVLACRDIFDVRRVQQWTAELSRWCAQQQELKPYRGQCLVHRSEIMQLRGDWVDAMAEIREACEHLSDPPGDPVMGMARYQQAELHRLRGEFVSAESGYRAANDFGHTNQPGMALLRLAQGRPDDAAAAIRRALGEARGPVERSKVLSASAEIELAVGNTDAARQAAEELARVADEFGSPYLRAVEGYARGAVLLADGDPHGACAALRQAWTAWHELAAPYETARVRLLLAEACSELGDHDSAAMELAAARHVFEELGATPALAAATAVGAPSARPAAGGLTEREVEVLRLVATGATNRSIADSLVISDKTVARHVSNIFSKLNVSSRAAATAYAYERRLV